MLNIDELGKKPGSPRSITMSTKSIDPIDDTPQKKESWIQRKVIKPFKDILESGKSINTTFEQQFFSSVQTNPLTDRTKCTVTMKVFNLEAMHTVPLSTSPTVLN